MDPRVKAAAARVARTKPVKTTCSQPGKNIYEIRQTQPPPPHSIASYESYAIQYSFGPVGVVGYFNGSTNVLSVEVSVLGIHLGNYEADVTEGLAIRIELLEAKGDLRFYIKDGKDLWLRMNMRVSFDGTFNKDVRLIAR